VPVLDDALRRLCETLLDYPEGIDEARLRARLRLPVWHYDVVKTEAVENGLAEEATVFVGHGFVAPGRQLLSLAKTRSPLLFKTLRRSLCDWKPG
jgi:hypothetical protein